ncbi:uncharacterized protein ASCRUDRAFT_6463 [Ascoidea rubescens DSM 1968]|uniref:Uncharacterized protein n=1 Tax=Ascoidea rubescens DSM 1968 TaxID=1344418 RepID=A0A1D2VMI8_9ASCO|nr:hypothetical protein ASCRUDRAFT_6463 [Ascoidea rubescens DSM 1968]ODV62820.1 hypothetical protein ASCRUDRAFT_6463 [Ascoidea rubescens DSM 1968]
MPKIPCNSAIAFADLIIPTSYINWSPFSKKNKLTFETKDESTLDVDYKNLSPQQIDLVLGLKNKLREIEQLKQQTRNIENNKIQLHLKTIELKNSFVQIVDFSIQTLQTKKLNNSVLRLFNKVLIEIQNDYIAKTWNTDYKSDTNKPIRFKESIDYLDNCFTIRQLISLLDLLNFNLNKELMISKENKNFKLFPQLYSLIQKNIDFQKVVCKRIESLVNYKSYEIDEINLIETVVKCFSFFFKYLNFIPNNQENSLKALEFVLQKFSKSSLIADDNDLNYFKQLLLFEITENLFNFKVQSHNLDLLLNLSEVSNLIQSNNIIYINSNLILKIFNSLKNDQLEKKFVDSYLKMFNLFIILNNYEKLHVNKTQDSGTNIYNNGNSIDFDYALLNYSNKELLRFITFFMSNEQISDDLQIILKILQICEDENLNEETKLIFNTNLIPRYFPNAKFDKEHLYLIHNEEFLKLVIWNSIKFKELESLGINLIDHIDSTIKRDKMGKSLSDIVLSWELNRLTDFEPGFLTRNDRFLNKIEEVSSYKLVETEKEKEVENYNSLEVDYHSLHRSLCYLDVNTLNHLLETLVIKNLHSDSVNELIQHFKKTYLIEENIRTYYLLIETLLNEIRSGKSKEENLRKLTDAQDIFINSIKSGMDWVDSNNTKFKKVIPKIFEKTFSTEIIVDEEDLKEQYKFLKKFEKSVNTIDKISLNSVLKAFLKFDCVGNVIQFLSDQLEIDKENSKTNYYYRLSLNNKLNYDIYYTLICYFIEYKGNGEDEICWAVYGLLQEYFQFPFEDYGAVLKKLMYINNPRGALLVFQQMKRYNRLYGTPEPDTEHYKFLISSCGKLLFEEGILQLHAMYKMDLKIENDIGILNSFLEAYGNIVEPIKVRDIFESMLVTPRGHKNFINHQTINYTLRAFSTFAIEDVYILWHNLSDYEIEPDLSNYLQFIKCNNYRREYINLIPIFEEMERSGIAVNKDVLKITYNGIAGVANKKVFKESLKTEHLEILNELESEGQLIHDNIDPPYLLDDLEIKQEPLKVSSKEVVHKNFIE